MKNKTVCALACVSLVLSVAGCADKHSPDVYKPGAMQQVGKVDRAIVKSVREVDINDPSLGLGTAAGATAGGIAASAIGKGGGNAAAILGGVLVGGAIGYMVDQGVNSSKAFEYILEKTNGDLLTLAQKQDVPLAIGAKVLVLYGEQARIIPDEPPPPPPPPQPQPQPVVMPQ